MYYYLRLTISQLPKVLLFLQIKRTLTIKLQFMHYKTIPKPNLHLFISRELITWKMILKKFSLILKIFLSHSYGYHFSLFSFPYSQENTFWYNNLFNHCKYYFLEFIFSRLIFQLLF